MKFNRLNKKGLSLVEALLSVAFIAMLALGGASLISTFTAQQSIGQEQEAINNLKNNITTWFKNESNCNSVFAGKYNMDSLSSSASYAITNIGSASHPMEIPLWNKKGQERSLSNSMPITPNIKMKSIEIKRVPTESSSTSTQTNLSGTNLVSRTVLLNFDFEIVQNSGNSSMIAPKSFSINIPVFTNTSGMIVSCQAEANKELSCAAVGGLWDGTNCQPGKFCTHMGAYIVTGCNGDTSCNSFNASPNPLNNAYSCPAPATASLTFSEVRYSHSVSCGKKCSKPVTSIINYYTCLYCN